MTSLHAHTNNAGGTGVPAGLLEKYEYDSRFQKARKIESILKHFLGGADAYPDFRCLDVGCAIGVITAQLSRTFGQVAGLDPLKEALDVARALHPDTQAQFLHADGLHLPFDDATFNLVICAQVYEHSTNPARLVREIRRVLKPGGICFFSGPNRLWPIEYHYHWIGRHWLPRPLVDRYVRRQHGHPYDLELYTYRQLRGLWQGFERRDYTLDLIYTPGHFAGAPDVPAWARLIPRPVAQALRFLLPNFNWVVRKPVAP
ncbi:MAG: class I SAM-dependent methyltransferase [Anaerolineae bacterium]|nr:class I SAM-dependent methyltransferase [Anaerolineae bacterium]